MQDIADQIKELIAEARVSLQSIVPEKEADKSGPKAWSTKEVIGHLIDSAANNHQRFVRAAQNQASTFPPYDQEAWVAVQRYNDVSWEDLLDLWQSYNRHLCWVIACIPPDAKDDKALRMALDLIRGVQKNSAYPPNARTAVAN